MTTISVGLVVFSFTEYVSTQCTNHDATVNKAASSPERIEGWVFLRACDLDIPDVSPGCVQLLVHRVHACVVRGHRVVLVHRDAVVLRDWRTTSTVVVYSRRCEDNW